MHDRTGRPLAPVAAVLGAAVLGCGPAGATDPSSASLGPWLFASVALVLVAVASYAAGSRRRVSQRQPPAQAEPAGSGATAGNTPPEPAPAPPDAPGPRLLSIQAARLSADARPVLLLQASTEGWRLLQLNAPALRTLGADVGIVGRPWAEVEATAPAALRAALRGGGSPEGPWWLLHDDADGLCLALGPDGDRTDEETASLVYTVSHDLRAPIRVVEGFTRIVKEDYGRQLDRVGNDHLDRVLAAGARMNQMIDAVLTMARLASQPLARQPVDLSQQANFIVDELRRAAPERSVDVRIDPGLRVQGDPTLLRLVLENLLGNAWKYSGRTAQPRIEFGVASDAAGAGGRRVFMVRDNGAGFDMRVADRLFGLFQRLHSAKDFAGTGVGLASVRRIVQRHGGEVWAESEPGQGAAFFFTLPG